MTTSLYTYGQITGAKAKDENFFAEPFNPQVGTQKAIDFIVDSASDAKQRYDIEITFDNGKTWCVLMRKVLGSNITRKRVCVTQNDFVNFRCSSGDGVTLSRFTVIGDLDA